MWEMSFRARPSGPLARFTSSRPRLRLPFEILSRDPTGVALLVSFRGPPTLHHAFDGVVCAGSQPLQRAGAAGSYRVHEPRHETGGLPQLLDALEAESGGALLPRTFAMSDGIVTGRIVITRAETSRQRIVQAFEGLGTGHGPDFGVRVLQLDRWDPLQAVQPEPGALTPREVETVRLALQLGYYESPRRCRMEDIAIRLGISKSAVYHRMSGIERKAMEQLVDAIGPGRALANALTG